MTNQTIPFNPGVRLILADVDQTVADVYQDAVPEMIVELNSLLAEGKVLFLVSGAGLQSIRERITDYIKPELRYRIVIAHCMGAEVWGFKRNGDLNDKHYFGVYEGHFTEAQKTKWREIIQFLIKKYQLQTFPTMSQAKFEEVSKRDPLSVMFVDRGPQITLEFTNSVDLTEAQVKELEKKLDIKIPQLHGAYDLRVPVASDAEKLYEEAGLPIVPKMGGTYGFDNVIKGVNKTTAIKFVLEHETILEELGIHKADIEESKEIEIWGDNFNQKRGWPDFFMCLAVSPEVRAIDFRDENIDDLPKDYNIQFWNGEKRLHEGLLEYLQGRKK